MTVTYMPLDFSKMLLNMCWKRWGSAPTRFLQGARWWIHASRNIRTSSFFASISRRDASRKCLSIVGICREVTNRYGLGQRISILSRNTFLSPSEHSSKASMTMKVLEKNCICDCSALVYSRREGVVCIFVWWSWSAKISLERTCCCWTSCCTTLATRLVDVWFCCL